jgi:hypothetical protein
VPTLPNKKPSFHKYLLGHLSLAFLGAVIGLNHLLMIPSDPKNQVLFGYSSSRLGLIFFFIVAIISTAYFALKSWRNLRWAQKIERLLFGEIKTTLWGLSISGIVFFIFGLFLLIPSNQFAEFAVFAERLRPFAIYIAQISFQTIIFLRRNQRLDWKVLKRELIAERITLWIGGGWLVSFAGVWGLISSTGIGTQPNTRTYWYESGVPVLAIQMLFLGIIASAISHLISWILRRSSVIQEKYSKWLTILLGAGIWGLAAFLWNTAPMPRNTFWAPGPFPPANAYLPYSDAATFDIYAQFALIGQGIANGNVSVGHNAYIGFLAFLHLLAGQDYALLVGLQVALFAVFPVIVFFIGKIMHSRFLGLFLAGLVIVQELNAIASGGWLNLSHSRFLLSEFPTKIGMAALILLLFLWLREPGKNAAYALPLGGILGVLVMVRYNTLAMPFTIITGIMFVFGKKWRKSLKASLILVLTLFITIAPWMWRSWKLSGDPFFFTSKVRHTLAPVFQESPKISPTHAPTPTDELESLPLPKPIENAESPSPPQIVEETRINKNSKIYSVGEHFLHNLLTSFFILPSLPLFDFLPPAIADGSLYKTLPYWRDLSDGWLENLPPIAVLGLGLNLLILSIGIGDSFRKWKFAGWVPLGIFLAYHLSTALIHDSGGRYLVPVDWTLFIYFGLGLLQIARWLRTLFCPPLTPPEGGRTYPFPLRGKARMGAGISTQASILLTLPFFLFVLSMTLIDQTLPPKYTFLNQSEVLAQLIQEDLLEESDIDIQSLEIFLEDPNARAIYGMNLYPRFFWQNQGLERDIYLVQPYSRLAFRMIGAFGSEQVILPLLKSPPNFYHGDDVIVIGCYKISPSQYGNFGYIDALLVATLGKEPTIYTRSPAVPLVCPLPEP